MNAMRGSVKSIIEFAQECRKANVPYLYFCVWMSSMRDGKRFGRTAFENFQNYSDDVLPIFKDVYNQGAMKSLIAAYTV